MHKAIRGKDIKVVCVLRESGLYGPDYVEKLRQQFERYAPELPFYCISDVEVPAERIVMRRSWSGWWSKMEVFRPDINGDVLYVDLDTIICDKVWDFLNVNELVVLRNFFKPELISTELMYLPKVIREVVWLKFTKHPNVWIERYRRVGNSFLNQSFRQAKRWQDILPGRVISYKADKVYQDGVPKGTGIVTFQGRPKPRDISWEL